jgi:uncharacterized membrane protein YccC
MMTKPLVQIRSWLPTQRAAFGTERLRQAVNACAPPLLFGIRLWASVCLALYVAFYLELNDAYWAGISAGVVCQPQLGSSLRKGWFRMVGTVVGGIAIVTLTALWPQNRPMFFLGLALWGGVSAFAATQLRNFAGYAAALAGYTAAIIAGDQLGATGGLNGHAFPLAVTRVSEICIGIVSAGIVLAITDLGGARRRLAELMADLVAGIMGGYTRTLAMPVQDFPETQPLRRDFVRRIIALDPIIDQTMGESSQIRYHTPVLQQAADGLFSAMSAWRAVANHLVRLPSCAALTQATPILRLLPPQPHVAPQHDDPVPWLANPTRFRTNCEAVARHLIALPAETPSQRLLADKSAEILAGLSHALGGLALLVADPARSIPRRTVRLRMPDWLPALVNAARVFVTIGLTAGFWIVTEWPNGASTITWAALTVILMSPRADQAYAQAWRLAAGNALAAISAAVMLFAVLPKLQTFAAFSIAIGAYLVPVSALMAQPWEAPIFTPMATYYCAFLGPENHMRYDTVQYYNASFALVAGCAVAAVMFRLLPPLSPAFRTRRLLVRTLRDLRRLARGRVPNDWDGHVHGRLSEMPESATPLQRALLLAALSAGIEIIQLRHIAHHLGFTGGLDPALAAIEQGDVASATAHFVRLDAALAARVAPAVHSETVLRARGRIIALSEVLTQHATYFSAKDSR